MGPSEGRRINHSKLLSIATLACQMVACLILSGCESTKSVDVPTNDTINLHQIALESRSEEEVDGRWKFLQIIPERHIEDNAQHLMVDYPRIQWGHGRELGFSLYRGHPTDMILDIHSGPRHPIVLPGFQTEIDAIRLQVLPDTHPTQLKMTVYPMSLSTRDTIEVLFERESEQAN